MKPGQEERGDTQLKILQWNCRAINRNLQYLENYLSEHFPDVLCIQSLKCPASKLPDIKGYYYPPIYKTTGDNRDSVPVATYVKRTIQFHTVSLDIQGDEDHPIHSVAIAVRSDKEETYILNLYAPKSVSRDKVQWLEDLFQEGSRWLVVGDFNAHHPLWYKDISARTHTHEQLAEAILASDLCILNTGDLTRVPDKASDSPSAIDLSLVSSVIYPVSTWELHTDTLGSDHIPILVSIDAPGKIRERIHREVFKYEKADWSVFRSAINDGLENVISEEVDELNDQLTTLILQAARKAIPVSRPPPPHHPARSWWSEDCQKAVDLKHQTHSAWKKHRTTENFHNMKKAKFAANRTVAKAKKEAIEAQLLSEIKNPTDLSAAWKIVREHKNRYCSPEAGLDTEEKTIYKHEEKAELFADTFSQVSQTCKLPSEEAEFRRLEEEKPEYSAPTADNELPINSPLTLAELKVVLATIQTSGVSTGLDQVSYRMLAHLPEEGMEKLLFLFNKCYSEGKTPRQWEKGVVVPIPKPNKPKKKASSYRPVTLTSHISKVLERLIKNRLQYHLDRNNIIPTVQAGFRKGRSCTDQLYSLTAHVKAALKKKKKVWAAMFDIKRAFDTVWHKKLLFKIKQIGLSGNVYTYLQNFLKRSMVVRVGNSLSTERKLDCGVPQGTVLAPVLFNIMLHDLPQFVHTSVPNSRYPLHLSQFADDLAIYQTGQLSDNKKTGTKYTFQQTLDTLNTYMKINGFNFSIEKTQLILFSKKKVRVKPILTIQGQRLHYSDTVKFLGVTFRYDLNWSTHIQNLIKKAVKATYLLKVLKSQPWGQNPQLLVHLHNALVRSHLTYGQECFFSAPKTLLRKLETTEMKSLKHILSVPTHAQNEAVYCEAGLEPLTMHREKSCALFASRVFACENNAQAAIRKDQKLDHIHQYNVDRLKERRPSAKLPISETLTHYVESILTEAGLTLGNVVQHPTCPVPPWALDEPVIQLYNIPISKKDSVHYQKSVALEFLNNNYHHSLLVYTDGSVSETGYAGAGFSIPDLKVKKSFTLGRGYNICTAELVAIATALQYCVDLRKTPTSITICSDSQAALKAIQSPLPSRPDITLEIRLLLQQLKVKGSPVTLQWVPAHVGLHGNEMADAAAKAASHCHPSSSKIRIPPSTGETKTAIKRAVRKRWKNRQTKMAQKYKIPAFTVHKKTYAQTSRHIRGLAHRISTNSWRLKYHEVICHCGEAFSPEHIIFECYCPPPPIEQVRQKLRTLGVENLLGLFTDGFNHLIEEVMQALIESPLGAVV